MLDKMFKIANTIVGITRSKPSGEDNPLMMQSNRENYEKLLAERRAMIEDTRKEIQNRIETACRTENHVDIFDLGFEYTSSHLFEDSWQEKVVKMLEKDGYLCIMTFRYRNGKPENYLTVKW